MREGWTEQKEPVWTGKTRPQTRDPRLAGQKSTWRPGKWGQWYCVRGTQRRCLGLCTDTAHSPGQESEEARNQDRMCLTGKRGRTLGGLATETLVCMIWEPVCVVGKGLLAILPLRKLRRAVKESRFYGFSGKPRGFSRGQETGRPSMGSSSGGRPVLLPHRVTVKIKCEKC